MNCIRILLLLICASLKLTVKSQLCQGSLGDPIVNITFGSGTNPGPALSAAATNYLYMSSDCPNDGQYAVRNRTDNCYPPSWHSLTSDHTGNPGGYFMLVNASFQPSAFYVDTVDLFCSNTVYEFAAWVLDMMKTTTCVGNPTILPNLSFNIEKTDGTVLQTYNTGNIPVSPTVNWTQYGFFFTAPAGVNRVVLRIINNAPGGCGNDLALDDITFRPCGPLVTAMIAGDGNSKDLCKGDVQTVTFSATVSAGFDDPYYQWQQSVDGNTWTDIAGANSITMTQNYNASTPAAIYQYRLSVSKKENNSIALCRISSKPVIIRINQTPSISITGNSPLCQNSTISIVATGATNYDWTGPNGLVASGATINISNAQPAQSGKYYLLATNDAGCSSKDSILITVNPRPQATAFPVEISICEGNNVQLSSSGGGSYLWKPASGLSSATIANPLASPSDSTRYAVIVSNSFSCSDTAYSQVNVFRKPVSNAGPDKELLTGQSVQLSGAVKGTSVSYSWSPPYAIDNINSLQPTVTPLVDTTYILTVNSGAGCGTAKDSVKVRVFKGIYVPTAFTPNNDGLNDQWKIAGLSIFKDKEISVYNRYGQLIYSTTTDRPWDGKFNGKPQPTGIYPYIIRVRDANITLKGWVAIIR